MRIFADTADLTEIERLSEDSWVSGFTTNPTLFKNTKNLDPGVTYQIWAKTAVKLSNGLPISIDGPVEKVWDLGDNAIPKVCVDEVRTAIYKRNRPVNWTAVCNKQQMRWLQSNTCGFDIVSVFAGRIMDTGRDVEAVMKNCFGQSLWASTRSLYDRKLAEAMGFDIITMSPALIDKMHIWWDMPLEAVAAETIRQFDDDRPEW